eukprot:scaffold19679_cov124-Isochrysis_galbana.AAC.6
MPRIPKPLFSRLSRAPILAPQDGPTPSQVLVCVFFLGCKFGDAVSQAAQAYLPACFPPPPPPTPGAPLPLPSVPPAARRLSMRLMRLAALMGAAVAATALAVVTRAPGLFTNSPEVVAAMRGAAPLLATALSMHACTVGTEGLLIGSRQLGFLVRRGMACPDSHCSVLTSSEGFGTLRPPAHTPPHTLSSGAGSTTVASQAASSEHPLSSHANAPCPMPHSTPPTGVPLFRCSLISPPMIPCQGVCGQHRHLPLPAVVHREARHGPRRRLERARLVPGGATLDLWPAGVHQRFAATQVTTYDKCQSQSLKKN